MTAGNHDRPRAAETGCILARFRTVGITVIEHETECLRFHDLGLSLFAVSDRSHSHCRHLRPVQMCAWDAVCSTQ